MNNALFASIEDQQFLDESYGQRVAYGPAGTTGTELRRLFADVRSMFSSQDSSVRGDLLVFKDGVSCKDDILFDAQSGAVRWDRIWSMYAQEGATVYLRGIQKHFPAVRACLARIEPLFAQRKLFANLFISPSNAVGLNAHFDATDFIVYQLEGEKQWALWPAPPPAEARKLTSKTMAAFCQGVQQAGNPAASYALNAGEALYLPLYTIHAPRTSAAPSTHITMGFAPAGTLAAAALAVGTGLG